MRLLNGVAARSSAISAVAALMLMGSGVQVSAAPAAHAAGATDRAAQAGTAAPVPERPPGSSPAGSQPVRLGSPASVGGAFARQGGNACSWTVGSPGIEKTFSFAGGSFTMSSFRNTLVSPAREYVTAGAPSPGFSFGWDGTELSGVSGGWACVSGAASRVLAGGAPALQLDVVLSRQTVRVSEHYLIYPDVAFIAEWADYAGTDGQDHQLSHPSFLDQQIMGGAVADTDLLQTRASSTASGSGDEHYQIEPQPLGQSPAPGFTSAVPWLALWDRVSADGVYAGDVASVGSPTDSPAGIGVGVAGGSVSLMIVAPDVSLAAGESFTSPHAFVGVYHKDLDDMTNRLLDWQYGYMWDYTRAPYFPAVRDEGFWGVGSNWAYFGDFDSAGTLQKVFDLSDHLRAIGVDVYARDAGFGSQDWRLTNDYLVKSGMRESIYNQNDTADWGPIEWRIDGQGLPGDNSVQTFLDGCQLCGYNGVGLPDEFGFNLVRFADGITYTLIGNSSQDGASRLFPMDKMYGVPEFTGQVFRCTPAWANVQLMQNPYLYGDTSDPALAECTRKMIDMYHYLASQGVVGRWVQQYHPHASDNLDTNWFERLSGDGRHGLILYKGQIPCYMSLDPSYDACDGPPPSGTPPLPSASPVTVYPKGLNPDAAYDVRFEIQPGHVTRTGADLMARGVTFTSVKAGERIYLGLPGHPGAGTDHVPPQPPAQVSATVGTNMGYPGVEVRWAAGRDNNWVSYYQVLRDGTVIGQVAKGAYYFDHTLGVAGARYAVRTADGDGNVSAAVPASQVGLPSITTADDASSQVTYTGTWAHQSGVLEAGNQTQSVTTMPSCHLACRGFSGTQGAGNWTYEYTPLACHLACQQFSGTQGQNAWRYQRAPVPCHVACQGFGGTQGANGWGYQDGPPPPCLQACQQFSGVQGQDNWSYQERSGPTPPPCHLACQQFSGVQGQDGWSYQTSTGGVWADIATYDGNFGLGGDCCAWFDLTSGTGFSGLVSPRFVLGGVGHDAARAWTAPKDGTVDISAQAIPFVAGSQAVLTITENGQPIFGPQTMDGTTNPVDTSVTGVSVSAGDVIRFEVQGTANITIQDLTQWDPDIHYQGDPPLPPPPPPPPFADMATYHGSEDFSGDGPFWYDGNSYLSARLSQPASDRGVARAWTAPRDGVVDITGRAAGSLLDTSGAASEVSITKNDQVIWGPQTIGAGDASGQDASVPAVAVSAGDVIRFEVATGGGTVAWDPDVTYQGDPPVVSPPPAWADMASYHPGEDFAGDGPFWHDTDGYIAARFLQPSLHRDVARTWTAATDGTIDITGYASSSGASVSITRNGQAVWGPQNAGDVGTNVSGLAVSAGDVIRFQVAAGSQQVYWDPDVAYQGAPAPRQNPGWADISDFRAGEDLAGDGPFWRDSVGTVSARDVGTSAFHLVARAWTAPRDGVVDIVASATPVGKPAQLSITRNDEALWGPQVVAASTDTNLTGVAVSAGDVIRFVDAAGGGSVQWDPDVFYQGDPRPEVAGDPSLIGTFNPDVAPDTNPPPPFGADGGYWHDLSQSNDHEAAGYISQSLLQPGIYRGVIRVWTAPKSGVVDIAAAALAAGGSTLISISKNKEVIWGPQTVDGSSGPVDTSVRGVPVAAGDRVEFQADAGGGMVAWDPEISYAGDPPPPADVLGSASWSFTGSQVTWFAKLGRDMGKAQVSIDGQPDAVIDLSAPDANNWSVPVYTRTFAAVGRHTITVTALADGTSDIAHKHINIDGFQAVGDRPVVTQESGPRVSYTGTGWAAQADAAASGGRLMASSAAGDAVSFAFTGASITWVGRICPSCGEADLYLDGAYVTRVDTFGYKGPLVPQAAVFQQSWAHPGSHTITIVVRGTATALSQGTEVDIDSFHVR